MKQALATAGPAGYWRKLLELETAGGAEKAKDQVRIAMLYTKCGERDKALAALERAFAHHSGDMVFVNREPCFESLHGDPRFQAIVQRVGTLPA